MESVVAESQKEITSRYLLARECIAQKEQELVEARAELSRLGDLLAKELCPYPMGQQFVNISGERAVLDSVAIDQVSDDGAKFSFTLGGYALTKLGKTGRRVALHTSGWRPVEKETAVKTLPSLPKIRTHLVRGGIEKGGLRLNMREGEVDGGKVIRLYGYLSYRQLSDGELQEFARTAQEILDKCRVVAELTDDGRVAVIFPQ